MAEIGATLREARMRAGIDIAEVESRTKIRAKYLRALENEEWSLLPGPTFVKSFLRTYAETLGLDAKLLVEEYKFRHEPYESAGAPARRRAGAGGPTSRGVRRGGRGGRRGGGAFGPPKRTNLLPLLLLIVLIAGAVYAVYRVSKKEDAPPSSSAPAATTPAKQPASEADAEARRAARAKARKVVRLRVAAPRSRSVYVCVRDARGRAVVNARTLEAGERTRTYDSQRFQIALNTAGARVTDGGKRLSLKADARGVVAYEITKGRARRLPEGRRPSCTR
ncbi:helix-turn-helix domain-containing protein [Patulibacter sp. SYSU D01012]|uniref:helix-turn-helix domain-containing protein n=1 Tax=Patulibacter sp. SYSU D01012 TaxID=2817381 RepID=UPI001B30CA3E|nr:helix-turn-helix domain-containing protein [Patulibacter sp. SYSU D01012]